MSGGVRKTSKGFRLTRSVARKTWVFVGVQGYPSKLFEFLCLLSFFDRFFYFTSKGLRRLEKKFLIFSLVVGKGPSGVNAPLLNMFKNLLFEIYIELYGYLELIGRFYIRIRLIKLSETS